MTTMPTYRTRGVHHAGDPEPAAGVILEVGSPPDPARGFTGDLLTFERLPTGEWIQQHNWSIHVTDTTFDQVAWWAPLRRVDDR